MLDSFDGVEKIVYSNSGELQDFLDKQQWGAAQTNIGTMVRTSHPLITMDFVKVGIPLTVIMWIALTAVLALAYNL